MRHKYNAIPAELNLLQNKLGESEVTQCYQGNERMTKHAEVVLL